MALLKTSSSGSKRQWGETGLAGWQLGQHWQQARRRVVQFNFSIRNRIRIRFQLPAANGRRDSCNLSLTDFILFYFLYFYFYFWRINCNIFGHFPLPHSVCCHVSFSPRLQLAVFHHEIGLISTVSCARPKAAYKSTHAHPNTHPNTHTHSARLICNDMSGMRVECATAFEQI